MNAKELLEHLLPAIDEIDGGCTVCINAFIKDANRELEKANAPFRLRPNPEYDFLEHRFIVVEEE